MAEVWAWPEASVYLYTGTATASALVAYAQNTRVSLVRGWDNYRTLTGLYQDALTALAPVGTRTAILVEGESRRGSQVQGRDPWHRVVNAVGAGHAQPGDLLAVEIVEATPHSLIAEPLPPAAEPEGLKVRSRTADEPGRTGIRSRWV